MVVPSSGLKHSYLLLSRHVAPEKTSVFVTRGEKKGWFSLTARCSARGFVFPGWGGARSRRSHPRRATVGGPGGSSTRRSTSGEAAAALRCPQDVALPQERLAPARRPGGSDALWQPLFLLGGERELDIFLNKSGLWVMTSSPEKSSLQNKIPYPSASFVCPRTLLSKGSLCHSSDTVQLAAAPPWW